MNKPSGALIGAWQHTNFIRNRAIVMAVILVGCIIAFNSPGGSDESHILSLVIAAFCIVALLGDVPRAIREPASMMTLYSDGFTYQEGNKPENEHSYLWSDVLDAGWLTVDLTKEPVYRHSYSSRTRDVDNAIMAAQMVNYGGQLLSAGLTGGGAKDKLWLRTSDHRRIQVDKRYPKVRELVEQLHTLIVPVWVGQMLDRLQSQGKIEIAGATLTLKGIEHGEGQFTWDSITEAHMSNALGSLELHARNVNNQEQSVILNNVGLWGEAIFALIKRLQEQPIAATKMATP
jgi:hypothetical protein